MSIRFIVSLLVLCAAQAWCTTARAEPATHSLRDTLHVRTGATCLTADNLAPHVQTWLQTDRVRADVTIAVEGNLVDPRRATFRVVQAAETLAHRAFSPGPARCEDLQAALALSIALALKASLIDELAQPLPDDPIAIARDLALAGAGVVAVGVLPGLSAGIDLRTELLLTPGLTLRMGALGLVGFDKALQDDALAGPSGRFDAALLALRIDVCAGIDITRSLGARACAGLLGGPLYAKGSTFKDSRGSTLGWVGFGNSVGALLRLSPRWSLELGLSLLTPLRRVSIGVHDTAGAVVGSRPLDSVGFAASLGPMYRL